MIRQQSSFVHWINGVDGVDGVESPSLMYTVRGRSS